MRLEAPFSGDHTNPRVRLAEFQAPLAIVCPKVLNTGPSWGRTALQHDRGSKIVLFIHLLKRGRECEEGRGGLRVPTVARKK